MRTQLLQLLTRGDDPKETRIVRRTVAEAVGSMAVLLLPSGSWPEFLPSLFQMSSSPVRLLPASRLFCPVSRFASLHRPRFIRRRAQVAVHRMSVALILAELVEMVPASVQAHLEQIRVVLFAGLADANLEVGAYAVSAVVSLLISVTAPQRKQVFRRALFLNFVLLAARLFFSCLAPRQLVECIPKVFNAIAANVASGDEDRVRDVLEALFSLVACDAVFLKPYLQEVVNVSVQLALNAVLEDETRKLAVEFLLRSRSTGRA